MEDTVTVNTQATPGNIAPWTMEEMVDDTLALKTLLLRETAALRRMDIATVKALHEEKLRLVRKLEIQRDLLDRDASLMQGVNAVQKKRLLEVSAGMDKAMKENFHEVLKAREVNSSVVRAISREVRKYEQRATGYNQRGITTRKTSYGGYDGSPSVALNQMI